MAEFEPRRLASVVNGTVRGNVTQIGVVHGNVQVQYERRTPAVLPIRTRSRRSADNYQVRRADAELADLIASVHTVVLSGMGGVGKSQLAVQVADRMYSAGDVSVLWVTASSRNAIVDEYARLAADLTGVEDRDPEVAAERLLGWLATAPARWLVVLDDLRAPADLRELWPPLTRTGRVLVTTRRRDSALRGDGRRVLHVDTFRPEESLAYLTAMLADFPELQDGATGLTDDLGHLPLALAQAATYVRDEAVSCAEYRSRFADRQRTLAALAPRADALPDEHAHTLATVLSLSIEHADSVEPVGLSRPVLAAAALLDPNGFPVDVLTNQLVTENQGVDAARVRDALRTMHRFNILTHVPEDAPAEVRVHALVQRATREQYTEREAADLPVVVAGALAAEWPLVERDSLRANVFRMNVAALDNAAGEALWHHGPPLILLSAENSLAASGQLEVARQRLGDLHAAAVDRAGPHHPFVLAIRDAMAGWQAVAGDVAGAISGYESVLALRERLLGPGHEDTLLSRAALAEQRGRAGDPEGALAAVDGVLAKWATVSTADHPMTLNLLISRAGWLGQTAGASRAIAEFDALLVGYSPVLGDAHPLVFALRGHRALWESMAGNHAAAATALEQLLADQTSVLGALHPQTLALRGSLAHIGGLLHGPSHAADALEALLADQLQAFDPDHPQTVALRNAIEVMRSAAG